MGKGEARLHSCSQGVDYGVFTLLDNPFYRQGFFVDKELEPLSTSDDQNLLAAVLVSLFEAG